MRGRIRHRRDLTGRRLVSTMMMNMVITMIKSLRSSLFSDQTTVEEIVSIASLPLFHAQEGERGPFSLPLCVCLQCHHNDRFHLKFAYLSAS